MSILQEPESRYPNLFNLYPSLSLLLTFTPSMCAVLFKALMFTKGKNHRPHSWGYLSWDALLNSSRASEVDVEREVEYPTILEYLSDRSFNFRVNGLNIDFTTYSMLALANANMLHWMWTPTWILLIRLSAHFSYPRHQ